jgi:hypothetical protein
MAATLMQRLRQVLASDFSGAEVNLRRYQPGRRIGGSITWEGFEGKPQIDRQVELRRAINEHLLPEERTQVSFILTLTPAEQSAMAEAK